MVQALLWNVFCMTPVCFSSKLQVRNSHQNPLWPGRPRGFWQTHNYFRKAASRSVEGKRLLSRQHLKLHAADAAGSQPNLGSGGSRQINHSTMAKGASVIDAYHHRLA